MLFSVRNIAGMIAVLGLILFSIYFQSLRDKAEKYGIARDALKSERANFAAYKTGIEAEQQARKFAAESYHAELAALRAEIHSRPVPVVRLCPPAAGNTAVPASQNATGRAGAGTAPAGLVPSGTESDSAGSRDIGPELYRLADTADELSARTRATYRYLRE